MTLHIVYVQWHCILSTHDDIAYCLHTMTLHIVYTRWHCILSTHNDIAYCLPMTLHIVYTQWHCILSTHNAIAYCLHTLTLQMFFGHHTNLLININFLNGCLQRSKYIKLWISWELHVYRQDGSHIKKGRSYPICCLTLSLFSFRILNLLKDLFLQSYYNFVRRSYMQCQCV
jgi:hypothetical protein